MSNWLVVFDKTITGVTLGTVIPSVISFAAFICRFIIKIKKVGWKSINESEWRELGQNIENEFNIVSSSVSGCSYHCNQCQTVCSNLQKQVEDLRAQLAQTKQRLLDHTSSKIERHTVTEQEKSGRFAQKEINKHRIQAQLDQN